jgi:hypothetical protein
MFWNATHFVKYASIGNWNYKSVADPDGVSDASSNIYGIVYNIGTSSADCSANFTKFLSNLASNGHVNEHLNLGLTGLKNAVPSDNHSVTYLRDTKKMRIKFDDRPTLIKTRDINLPDVHLDKLNSESPVHFKTECVVRIFNVIE